MGFIGSLFGGDSGNTGGAGMNYQATGPEQYQLNDAWANTQNALGQQQAFINALNPGLGIGNQNNVFQQQQALAGQLQNMMNGGGPNPAQAQFQQNANQVAAQTAGLIGSQKGISPALQARLIAQQGAGAQQGVAGQAATLQAQQQLAATQALQQQQANMANLSTQQVGQSQNALSGYQQGALQQQSNVLGLQTSANSANAGVSQTVAKGQGGLLNGIAGSLGMAGFKAAHGGIVPGYADGGVITPAAPYAATGPQSAFGKSLIGMQIAPQMAPLADDAPSGSSKKNPPIPGVDAGQGMDTIMGGGAGDVAPGLGFGAAPVAMAARGGVIQGEAYANQMRPVPGKAAVKGDSPKNDTVSAKLSPGEVIIPRSVMQSSDPAANAAKFVAAVMAKNRRGLPR